MRIWGINYDTGLTLDGRSTRPTFREDDVRRDIGVIAENLHATAIRVSGEDLERLEVAGRYALERGLELWFSPTSYNLAPDAFLDLIARCAERAECLRARGAVVAVLGGEISLFGSGFVPGHDLASRVATMVDPATWADPDRMAAMQAGFQLAKDVQRSCVRAARAAFQGPVTYASGAWEEVEWDHFDIVSVDAYRDAANARTYREQIRGYRRYGKPVAIAEFGCCTYTGAADAGGSGWQILDPASSAPALVGTHRRDESEQVRYFDDLIEIFDAERVDAAFWFSFAAFALPHRDDPAADLDLASYGVVAVLDDPSAGHTGWRRKQVFDTIAANYGRRRRSAPDRPLDKEAQP
jgi:hypothetical protein